MDNIEQATVRPERLGYSKFDVCEGTASTASTPPCNARITSSTGTHKLGSSTFNLDSREVQFTGPGITVQRAVSEKLMFTPGSRLQVNLPVDPTQKHGPENPFPGFYRSIVIHGGDFAMTSDGVPGIDITEMCANGIHNSDQYKKCPIGVHMVNSFENIGCNNATGSPSDHKVYSMLVPLVKNDDPNVIEHRKNIKIWRKTMDPPCVSQQVYDHRMQNSVQIETLDVKFPDGHSFEHYMASGVYVPTNEISIELLTKQVNEFNRIHAGVQVAAPIRYGSTNVEEGSFYCPIQFEVFPNH
jgi:hypothetical protein